jgi:hypothetical protein
MLITPERSMIRDKNMDRSPGRRCVEETPHPSGWVFLAAARSETGLRSYRLTICTEGAHLSLSGHLRGMVQK